jgi:NAD dependent epimerase/dehydratase
MRHALVTGADGFIGSHLTEMMLVEGVKVRALAQYNSFNHWGWLDGVRHENLEIVAGDVRDPNLCRDISRDVDVICHLAALIAIPYSYVAPDSYVDTNIKGTLNICQAALANKVERVIVASTSEVYGTALYTPIDEKHPKQPQSPYSATKIGADALALSFHHAFSLPVVVARPFNTYGPRQSARAIIPAVIIQIASGMKRIKVGDLSPTRDFNFVTDTCRGFLALAACDQAIGEEVNICGNSEISMRATLELIARIMKREVDFVKDEQRVRPAKSEVFRLRGDNAKIRALTGFEPRYSLEDGLRETAEWFLDPGNLAAHKADIYNV